MTERIPTPSHLTPRTDAYGETDMKSKPLTCSKEEWEHFASVLQGWAKLCRDLELELNAASKPTGPLALDAGGAMIGQAPYTGCIGDVTKQAPSSETKAIYDPSRIDAGMAKLGIEQPHPCFDHHAVACVVCKDEDWLCGAQHSRENAPGHADDTIAILLDAERYRWWRSKWTGPEGEFDVLNDYLSACETAEQCDAAIDAGRMEKP